MLVLKRFAVLAVVSGAAGAVWGFPSAVTFVEPGETVSLVASTATKSKVTDSESNKYGSFVYAQGDCTLKVTVPNGATQAALWSALFVTNGVLTLDLTDVASAGIPYYQYGGIITRWPDAKKKMCEGKIVVKGLSQLVCGDPANSYPRFEITDIGFRNADGSENSNGSLMFTSNSVLMATPPCAWSLASSGLKTLSLGASRILDGTCITEESGSRCFDFPNCSTLQLIDNDMIDPEATIRVPASKTLNAYYSHYGTTIRTTPNTSTAGSEGFF